MLSRECTRCHETKTAEHFYKNKRGRNGLHSWCKACVREDRRTKMAEARHDLNSKASRYRLYENAKRRAREKGIEFSITWDDIEVPQECPVLGIQLKVGYEEYGNSPSLDRLKPNKGYVPGNIAVISTRANAIKNDANSDDVFKVAYWMLEHGL